jgi:hypothetical protein
LARFDKCIPVIMVMGTLVRFISSTSAEMFSVSSDWPAATSIGGPSSSKSISEFMLGISDLGNNMRKMVDKINV